MSEVETPAADSLRRALLVALGLALLAAPATQAQRARTHDQRLAARGAAEKRADGWTDGASWRSSERPAKGSWTTESRDLPQANGAAPADDCEWSDRYGYGGPDGPVYAQTTFDDGTGEALYVGGDFLTAGGVPVFGVARWDGTSWSDLAGGMNDVVFALATFDDGTGEALYAGGFFTTAGGVPAAGIAKWNGTTWSALAAGVGDSVFALAVWDDGGGGGEALYVGGFFSTAGGMPANNIAKWDGSSWSTLGLGVDDEVDAFAVFDDGSGGGPALFVGGFFSNAGSGAAAGIAKWDGAWSPLGSGVDHSFFFPGVLALQVFDDGGGDALFVGGVFDEAGGMPASYIAKWDGTVWSDLDFGVDFVVLSLTTYDDGNGGGEALYAAGVFLFAGTASVEVSGVARWDGMDWSALGLGVADIFFGAEVDSLGVFDDGGGADLYAGGFFFEAGGNPASFLASWDGAAWSAVLTAGPDVEGTDDVVYVFQVFDDGTGPALYAGGDFFTAGGVPVFGIAKWDGTSWSPLGSGVECLDFEFPMATAVPSKGILPPPGCEFPTVQAMAVYDDGTGPALYVGGVFDLAGGMLASNIAKWDGTSWSALGDGTDAIVEALAVFDGELYAGGEFGSAGSVSVSNIARWNGTAWSDVGGGTDGDVETLAVFDDGFGEDLYAGGEFDNAGIVSASKIARWDGTDWSALGLGTDDEVETLFVYDDGGGADLYAGGQFDTAGGVPATSSIARWDGSAWSAVGGGMSTFEEFRTVDALAAFDDGNGTNLYAGGFFEFAGGVPAANIARWDGTTWSPLGAGTDEEIEALAVFNTDGPSLYAGGFFSFAGGLPSSYIGEWRCPAAELSIDDVTLAEGDAGTTDFVFTVTRSHNATDVSVDVATADGTAVAPADYAALPLQTLSFTAGGALTQTVTVSVTTDTVEEVATKSFFVNLTSPVTATIADSQGVGTILDDDDDGPPSVTVVDSIAGTGDGVLAECEEARVSLTRLLVTFDQPVRDPAGDAAADDVTNPANYRLFAAGADHDLGSSMCGPPAGDDVAIAIDSVTWDGGSLTATLDPAGGALADGPYRLVVCDEILDAAGNGLVGGDFARTFRVERQNLFVNGHLDCDLAGWTEASTDPGEIAWGGDDVDGASISGSAAVSNLTSSTDFSLGQCVPVGGGKGYELSGTVRLAAAAGVTVFLARSCDFYAAAGCAGTPLVSALDLLPLADTAGTWKPVASEVVAPPGSASAFCGFQFTAPGAESFSSRLDDLALVAADIGIFADGFESGDTSAWSATVP